MREITSRMIYTRISTYSPTGMWMKHLGCKWIPMNLLFYVIEYSNPVLQLIQVFFILPTRNFMQTIKEYF